MSTELLVIRADTSVHHVISAVAFVSHFLPLPAAPSCSTSLLNNVEDLMPLWTCLCREPPAVLGMCERQTVGKLCSQFSRFYPQVMSDNRLCDLWVILPCTDVTSHHCSYIYQPNSWQTQSRFYMFILALMHFTQKPKSHCTHKLQRRSSF